MIQTKAAAERLKNHGVKVFAVGVGDEILEEELKVIATDPSKGVFILKSFEELAYKTYAVARAVCRA